MAKFICKSCGDCCKNSSKEKNRKQKKDISFLPLFEFEIPILQEEAEKHGIRLDIGARKAVFDKKSKKYLVLTYAINTEKDCPFLKKNSCLIYPKRPFACRMFPISSSGEFEKHLLQTQGANELNIRFCNNCSELKIEDINKLIKNKTLRETRNILNNYFGENYLYAIQRDIVRLWINSVINKLEKEGKMQIEETEKEINDGKVQVKLPQNNAKKEGFFYFIINNNLVPRQEVLSRVNEFMSCLGAKRMLSG